MEIKSNDAIATVVENGWDMSKCSIHPDLQKMLVEQMSHELYNNHLYSAFSNYYWQMGLYKLCEYYRKRAIEEYNHYLWCVNFAKESGVQYTTPAVDAISEKWNDVIRPFELTIDVEIETTELIYDMADKAKELGDHIFLQWLYKPGLLCEEQNEEMSLSRKALHIMQQDDSILAKQDAIMELYGN